MLKMIIADDELIVREGLRYSIPWEEFDIEVIAEASDGQEALELCELHRPDILFTDIRMPIMDGLEVSSKLQEQNMDIRIIIFSGIQDFNYAKIALEINAEGYILKPVKMDELTKVVKKVVASIKLERNKEQKLLDLKNSLKENLSIAREKFLLNLISGNFTKENEINEKFEYFNIPIFPGENFAVCVLEIDDYDTTTCSYMEGDKQLLSFSVTNIVEELLNVNNSGFCFCRQENEFVIIYKQSALINNEHIRICEDFLSCLDKFLHIPVSIGIGHEVSSVLQINSSFSDALKALKYKFYTGKKSILNIKDIERISDLDENSQRVEYSWFYESVNKLIGCIKIGDSDGTRQVIINIFNEFISGRKYPIEYVQSISSELFYTISKAAVELGEGIGDLTGNRSDIVEKIHTIKSIYELRDYLLSIFTNVSDYFSKKYAQKNEKIIKRIKDILDHRYKEDISVARISEEVFFSPNYISLIFKQETGETITEYITRTRMEAAKELLSTTDFKIFEVAEMVGYEDAHYFSTVFKKYTGILPAKFRRL